MKNKSEDTDTGTVIAASGIGTRGLGGRSPLLADAAPPRAARILLPVFFTLLFAAGAWACPMCKEVAAGQADSSSAANLRNGFGLSLGLLLSTPYILFGGITLSIVRSVRRMKKTGSAPDPK